MAMNFYTSNITFRQLMANGLSYRVPPLKVSEEYDAWDERKIAARQKHLAKYATGIWRIDS